MSYSTAGGGFSDFSSSGDCGLDNSGGDSRAAAAMVNSGHGDITMEKTRLVKPTTVSVTASGCVSSTTLRDGDGSSSSTAKTSSSPSPSPSPPCVQAMALPPGALGSTPPAGSAAAGTPTPAPSPLAVTITAACGISLGEAGEAATSEAAVAVPSTGPAALAARRAALTARVAELEAEWAAAGTGAGPVAAASGSGGAGAGRHRLTLVQMNQIAVSYSRAGDPLSAAAALTALLRAAGGGRRLTHRDLPLARANLAAALLAAGLAAEAAEAAEAVTAELEGKPLGLMDASSRRTLVRSLLLRGRALTALGRPAAAVGVLERGLGLDPTCPQLREALDVAGRQLAGRMRAGDRTERLALPAPEPRPLDLASPSSSNLGSPGPDMLALSPSSAAVSPSSCSASSPTPLALQLKWQELLPGRLLTPRAAEVDHRTRDTYNFVTIETDLRMPRRCLRILHDTNRMTAVQEAIRQAVAEAARGPGSRNSANNNTHTNTTPSGDCGSSGPNPDQNADPSSCASVLRSSEEDEEEEEEEEERDVRVLILGSCGGLLGLLALRAGATHVTCVERWLYLASAAGEVLAASGVAPERYRVCYRRPCELRAREDVPVCCNVVIATELLDDSLLGAGLLPALRHVAAAGLLTRGAVVVPRAATVWVQAAQIAAPQLPLLTSAHTAAAVPAPHAPTAPAGAAAAAAAAAAVAEAVATAGNEAVAVAEMPAEGAGTGSSNGSSGSNDGGRGGMEGSSGGGSSDGSSSRSEQVLDLSALDQLRWWPSASLGAPMAEGAYVPLSKPKEAWHFDLMAPADSIEARTLDVELETPGRFNAVVYWYEVQLYGDIRFVTHQPPRGLPRPQQCQQQQGQPQQQQHGQQQHPTRPESLQAAVHWLPGPIPVRAGEMLPLSVCHNTIALRFEVLTAEYQWLVQRDPSLPPGLWTHAADTQRAGALCRAVGRAVARLRAAGHEQVVAVDVGAGGGALALAAAAAGADSVTAAEVHPTLAATARRCAADNGLGHKVVVIQGDAGELELGRDVPYSGANLIICDLFDAGLLGHRMLATLECVKRKLGTTTAPPPPPAASTPYSSVPKEPAAAKDPWVSTSDPGGSDGSVQPTGSGTTAAATTAAATAASTEPEPSSTSRGDGSVEVVPAAARVWVVGVELLTRRVLGEDMSAMNKYRWDDKYEVVRLQDLPYRQLTLPVPVFDFDFTKPPSTGIFGGGMGSGSGSYPTAASVEAPVIAKGILNAVAFWYDLQPDKHHLELISNAPPGLVMTMSASTSTTAHATTATAATPKTTKTTKTTISGSFSSAAGPADGGAITDSSSDAGGADDGSGVGEGGGCSRRCQSLQYLDCALPVTPGGSGGADSGGGSSGKGGGGAGGGGSSGSTVVLQARRQASGLHFSLRPGVGVPVPRPPYKVEWGGGVSIENPHVQRARYCQLLVSEWLQRLPRHSSSRGVPSNGPASITQDLAPLWLSAGSLQLDPTSLAEVTHRLTLMERLYGRAAAGGAGLGADGQEVVAAAGGGFSGGGGGGGAEDGVEVEGRVGLVRPEDVSLGLPAVWF